MHTMMGKEIDAQDGMIGLLSSLVVGFYAWIMAIFFGAVLLDVYYSNLVRDLPGTAGVAYVFSNVSDFLLGIGFLTVIAGVGAIAFSWNSQGTRYWFIASLIVLFAEFFAPAFLPETLLINGDWLRITISASASLLAFVGLYKFYRFR